MPDRGFRIADELETHELRRIVAAIHYRFYRRYTAMGGVRYDLDDEVNGGDLVELVGTLFEQHGMRPRSK
jgi:hypothetical protein